MTGFHTAEVTDPIVVALLGEYFDGRARTFPGGKQEYVRTFPSPTDFEPPRGVFLIVEGEDLAGDAADVGCGGIRLVPPAPDGTIRYEIKHLYVQPHVRGNGTGGQLLSELERRAAGFGAAEVVLDTNASQAAAARLYERTGYEQIEPYNDNPNATHWYRKRLA